jgi:hypothetical protein
VDQAIESALNGAHWVRITSYGPNNLKFRTWASRGTRLWTVHEVCGPSHWNCFKWGTLGTDIFSWSIWL